MTPKTNILIALNNILARNSSVLTPIFRSNGTANAAGDSLEFFIKDMFCTGASQYQYEEEKDRVYSEYLSWTGDNSHFPDFIVRKGVGVEPKKMNSGSKSNLALNSSYPKDYIYPDSQNMPTNEQLDNEGEWSKKSLIYAVGNLNNQNNKLLSLWLVYGNTFIADREVYLNLIGEIRESISKTNATLIESKELARAIGIDPLKNSNLRVRGMYELKHPAVYFADYISDLSAPENATSIYVVMLKSELEVLEKDPNTPNLSDYISKNKLVKKEIMIPNPNNLAEKIEAVVFFGYTD